MKKTLRRTLAIMLMLVMLVGLFPNSIVTPAYAYDSTVTHRLQLNLPYANMRGGITNIGQLGLKNRITGVYNSNAMEGINNHSFDYDTPAFCINPVAGSTPGASYGYKGDGRSASEYWNSFSDYDKQVVSLIVEYYENHPTSSYNSIGDNVYWLAKMGAQVAIFLFVMDGSSQETMRDALSRRMWDDVLDYADDAIAWAKSNASTTTASVGMPSFNGANIELQYNPSTGMYTGSVTDTTGALSASYSTPYDFDQTVSGIEVSQDGNTVTITATPAAALAAGFQNENNSWEVSSTATDQVAIRAKLASLKIYSDLGNSSQQDLVMWETDNTPSYTSDSKTATLKAHAQVIGYLKVSKSSGDTSISNGNSCYSLANAEYKVYGSQADANSQTNAVATLTTDASGVTDTATLAVGTYYIRESSAPAGFELDSNVYTVSVSPNSTTNKEVTDLPINDPVPIVLRKKDDKTSTPGYSSGKMSLEGAQYTFKYYPGQYSTAADAEASGDPLRTWIVKTDADGYADIRISSYVVDGSDPLYYNGSDVSFPLGTVIIQETLAPTGYLINTTKYVVNITESGASSAIITDNVAITPETPIMGGVSVVKQDSQTGATAQGTATLNGTGVFEIVNNNGKSVTVNGTEYADGAVCLTLNTTNGAASSGKVLPYGDYVLREGTSPTGYKKNTAYSYSFTIATDNQTISAPTCSEDVLRGSIKIVKADSQRSGPQGNAVLSGAVFTVYNGSSNNPVIIDGTTYAAGAEIMTLTTGSDGTVTSPAVFPYGNYLVKETTPPTGYALNSTWSTTGVTVAVNPTGNGGQVFEAGTCANTVIRGNISVTKNDADHSGTPQGNATFAGAVFEVYNASSNPVVVDDTEYGANEVVMTITAGSNGVASSTGNKLPYGSYYIKEKTPPTGYSLNSTWTSDTVSITSQSTTVSVGTCSNTVLKGRLHVQKKDAGLGTTTPYGDASFEGVKFQIYNDSTYDVVVNGTTYAPGDYITEITALASGVASLSDNILPYGKYRVVETYTDPTKGYAVNSGYEGFAEITSANQDAAVDVDCENTGNIFGYIEVHKYDSANASATPQGDATLLGAKFTITNKSAYAVIVDGTTYAPDAVITTITTNASGVAKFTKALPMGTYLVQEDQSSPSTGYTANSTWAQTVLIRTNDETIVLENSTACPEDVITGGVSVQKYDKTKLEETGDYAQSMSGPGGMKLRNAEITIINRSAQGIWYDGHLIPPYTGEFDPANRTAPGIVTRIYTNDSGFATTGANDLPYGTYELHETDAPSGYLINDEWTKTIQIRSDGVIIELKEDDGVVDELCRTNIFFNKEGVVGSMHKRLGLVAFRLTNNDTGESHIIVTDLNGTYDSSTYLHTNNTNANDAAVDSNGNVDASLLDYEAGTWFGGGTVLDTLPDGTPVGAFPYSKTGYTLEELRTPASPSYAGTGNVGWDLMETWTVYIPKRLTADAYFIGTVTDTRPEGIRTRLTDKSSGEHQAEAANNVVLIDNVVYSGLMPGSTYTIRGYLVDKATGQKVLIDGNEVTCEKNFTPSSPNDAEGEPVQFTFDATTLAGKTVVAFEFLYKGEDLIASHEDLDSEAQTVSFPAISTMAHNADGQNEFDVSGAVEFIDTVYYENLEPGISYELTATLMDKATGNTLKDASNNVIKATCEFKPATRDGSVDVVFSLNGDVLAGKKAVVYEVLKLRGTTIARHEELDDDNQTLSFPKIATTLVGEGGIHTVNASGTITLTDTVAYSGLTIGKTYTVTGTLMDKESGTELQDASGSAITASQSFDADAESGELELTFTFDASALAGSSVVAYEELSNSIGIVAEHKDLTDADQTVVFPAASTTATDKDGHKDIYAYGTIKIVDEIAYTNLLPGVSYKASGKLMDKITGAAFLDKNGNEVTASVTFKPTEANGTVNVTFSFSAPTDLEGKDLVVFETITQGTVVVCVHEDLSDEDQTVSFPKIRTTALVEGIHEALATNPVTIVDTVTYNNLIPDEEYVVTGTLIKKSNGKPVRDADGDAVTATATFTPDSKDGTTTVVFTFDASALAGSDVVVYETLMHGDYVVAKHEDRNDDDQTVQFPYIRTTLRSEDDTQIICAEAGITVTDTVNYTGLTAGASYRLEGKLVDKDTGNVIVDADGNEVTATASFTANDRDGSEEITFTFNASNLEGVTAVAFEQLYVGTTLIAEHTDLDDTDQTVYVPRLGTTARDKDGNTELYADGTVVIYDDVEYEKLVPGKTYKLIGELMDKATGDPILDVDGNPVTAEKTFIATSPNNSVTMKFSFKQKDIDGMSVVVFESLYYGSTKIAAHADLDDDDQTVTFPKIRTTATVNDGHEALAADGVTIVDNVHYENLIPGETYKLSGVVVQKGTNLLGQPVGKPVRNNDDEEVRAEVEFTPDVPSGDIPLAFLIDAAKLEGGNVIVFETLTREDRTVAKHEDLDDEDQTVRFPKIRTTLLSDDGLHMVFAEDSVTLTDTITYTNLIPNNVYKISGKLVDKETGDVLTAEDGSEITAEATFTPDAADGTTEISFTIDATLYEGGGMVCFEQLFTEDDVLVAEHEDLDDEEQSVYVPSLGTNAHGTDGEKDILADTKITVMDDVEYKGLIPGTEYKLEGKLMEKETGEVFKDKDGNDVTASVTFTPDAAEGTTTLTFIVKSEEIEGKTLVAFETLFCTDVKIAAHEDLDDDEQTVTIPKIRTTAAVSGSRSAYPGEEVTIIDTVMYENLIPGEVYTLNGSIVYKGKDFFGRDKAKPVLDAEENAVEATMEFTPDEPNGTVEISFTFDASNWIDKNVIVFEQVKRGDRLIGKHEDLDDELQIIHFPTMGTTATGVDGSKHIHTTEDGQSFVIIDRIDYTNLIPGETYKVSGTLHDKVSNSVIKDENGDAYLVEQEFQPTEPNGYVEVTFTIPVVDSNGNSVISGKKIVVFETLMINGVTIAKHEDINSEEQTVEISFYERLFKYDCSDHHGLEGAEFDIRDISDSTEPVQHVISDADGYIYFNGLPSHEYAIKETKPPELYQTNGDFEYFVTVNPDGTLTGDVEIGNIRGGTVVVTKTDVITGDPVPGCEVTVYRIIKTAGTNGIVKETFEEVFKQETDSRGRIYFYIGEPGEYMYKETKTIYGYYLNEEQYRFRIAEDFTVTGDVHFQNVPFGTAVLKKTDKSGQPLAGAVFEVYSEDGRFLGRGESAANGRVYFVSPGPGKYYFVETKAPKGYQRVTERYHFTIHPDYTITGTLTIVNGREGASTKTGDDRHLGVWIATGSGLSVATAAALYFAFRKRKKTTEAK